MYIFISVFKCAPAILRVTPLMKIMFEVNMYKIHAYQNNTVHLNAGFRFIIPANIYM